MHIDRQDGRPTACPPESTFTGDVRIGGYFRREAPSRLMGATVTFAPGARTPWKVNPVGQTLVVLSGIGWTQCKGGGAVEVRAGDVIWYPPGERHWDGATLDQEMICVAIQEAGDSRSVEFGDAVTEEEHLQGPVRRAGQDNCNYR